MEVQQSINEHVDGLGSIQIIFNGQNYNVVDERAKTQKTFKSIDDARKHVLRLHAQQVDAENQCYFKK